MRRYDFTLTLITIGLLVALGAVCIYGTAYSFGAAQADREWTNTPVYGAYLSQMNGLAAPLLVGLVVLLGLCVPRRLFARTSLAAVSAGLLITSVLLSALISPRAGLGFLLGSGVALQYVVVLLTLARSSRLVFAREGLLVQLGSGLLHLGLVAFLLDLILIAHPWLHLAIFWLSAALIVVGMGLSFYAPELKRAFGRAEGEQAEEPARVKPARRRPKVTRPETEPAQT